MDPNKCLQDIRKAIDAISESLVEGGVDEADAEALADHVAALDAWLSMGGFLPDAWAKGRPTKTP
jgi:hypothetical protein